MAITRKSEVMFLIDSVRDEDVARSCLLIEDTEIITLQERAKNSL